MTLRKVLMVTHHSTTYQCRCYATIRTNTDFLRRTDVKSQADFLREFAKCDDIDFAYPTQRFYDNRLEGKAGTKPPSGGTETAPTEALNEKEIKT